jgi:hypothetical protein
VKLTFPATSPNAVDVPDAHAIQSPDELHHAGLIDVEPGADVDLDMERTAHDTVAWLILQGWEPADADASSLKSQLDQLAAAEEARQAGEEPPAAPVSSSSSSSTGIPSASLPPGDVLEDVDVDDQEV